MLTLNYHYVYFHNVKFWRTVWYISCNRCLWPFLYFYVYPRPSAIICFCAIRLVIELLEWKINHSVLIENVIIVYFVN